MWIESIFLGWELFYPASGKKAFCCSILLALEWQVVSLSPGVKLYIFARPMGMSIIASFTWYKHSLLTPCWDTRTLCSLRWMSTFYWPMEVVDLVELLRHACAWNSSIVLASSLKWCWLAVAARTFEQFRLDLHTLQNTRGEFFFHPTFFLLRFIIHMTTSIFTFVSLYDLRSCCWATSPRI